MQVIKFKKLALTLLLLLTIFEIFLYAIYLKYGLSKITSNTTSTKLVPAELMSTELLPTEFVATELVPTELVSTELVPTELLETEEHFEESNSELDDEFLVNTLGCKMTRLPVMTPNIQEYFKPPNKIVCLPPAITESDESYLWIKLDQKQLQKFYSITNMSLLNCNYQQFKRISARRRIIIEKKVNITYGEKYLISYEFIQVECSDGSDKYLEYHSFLPKKQEVLERARLKMLNESQNNQEDKLNVMILGIDTLSRLNFQRTMKKSRQTLDKLGGIEFFGYNKVADNTFPNVIPLLTGLNVSEFVSNCQPFLFYDKCHYIWKDFVSKGFQTVFGEDCGYVGLFTHARAGFQHQPTDYFFNTFILEAEGNIAYNKIGIFNMCLGDQKPNEVLFKYIEKFIKTKKDEKFFSFFWTSTMTHEFINYPILFDEDLNNLLIKMENQGYLNKTVLLLLSDHGIRYGRFRETNQGMIEERQPLLYFVLPKWFKQTYPEAHNNLKINTRRLTTPFDIYETMKDLLDPKLLEKSIIQLRSKEIFEMSILPKSNSLFLPVSPNRTCETTRIASHWCTCFDKNEIAISDNRTQKAATFIVKHINDLLKSYTICSRLSLNLILFANLEVSALNFNLLIKKNQTLYDLTVGIETKPSMAKFEATVRIPIYGNGQLQVLGTISRINKYGNQSNCIDDNNLKLYCFCIT